MKTRVAQTKEPNVANGEQSATNCSHEVTFLAESVYRELENAGYDRDCVTRFANRVLELVESEPARAAR